MERQCSIAREIQSSGSLIDGAIFADLASCETFNDRYIARFKSDTHLSYAVNAYEMAVLLHEASAHGPKELFASLQTLKPHQGVCGSFILKDTPETGKFFEFPTALYKVQNGAVVLYKQSAE